MLLVSEDYHSTERIASEERLVMRSRTSILPQIMMTIL